MRTASHPFPLIQKLESSIALSNEERAAVQSMPMQLLSLKADQDVVREGDRPRWVNIILDGFACRYKTLEDGRRQIVGFFTPGDICDPRVFILKEMDHSIASIGPLKVAEVSGDDVAVRVGSDVVVRVVGPS